MEKLQGAAAQGRCIQNARRDLLKQFLKNTSMPLLYWAEIPLWDESRDRALPTWFPFLLPHEIFARLLQSDTTAQPALHFLSPEMDELRGKLCSDLGIDPLTFIGVGLFGDGVPHSKRKTVECFSWNFIAEPDAARILSTCVEKNFCCQSGCAGRQHTHNHQITTRTNTTLQYIKTTRTGTPQTKFWRCSAGPSGVC